MLCASLNHYLEGWTRTQAFTNSIPGDCQGQLGLTAPAQTVIVALAFVFWEISFRMQFYNHVKPLMKLGMRPTLL